MKLNLLLPTLLVSTLPVCATSIAVATASDYPAVCANSDPVLATCSVNGPNFGSPIDPSQSLASDAWTSGVLEVSARGTYFGSAKASVSYVNDLMVTGASGVGIIQFNFVGFQDISGIRAGASISPVAVSLGDFSSTATLPRTSLQTFSLSAPVSFNSSTVFSVSFEATAFGGGVYHDGTSATNESDGILQFPTFVVTDATGNILPNASVSFVPEASTWVLAAAGTALLSLLRRIQTKA